MKRLTQVWMVLLLLAPAVASQDLEGLWDTSWGRLRLVRRGDEWFGAYSLVPDSSLRGTISGEALVFRWQEPEASGSGRFQLGSGGDLNGSWRRDGEELEHAWKGRRVVPRPDVRWLVVLEARWERGLAEPEYSFGDMLETHFRMAEARHVRVRHRWFHGQRDFRRLARETAYLAEPSVLVVSSHSSPDGVLAGGETIGAAAIADALALTPDLELLHLSGCATLAGPVPAEIVRRTDPAHRFPVSGYEAFVAWDSSALADYTFLTLLLVRGLDPAEAVRQTHLAAPFTGRRPVPGAELQPLGLGLVSPP